MTRAHPSEARAVVDAQRTAVGICAFSAAVRAATLLTPGLAGLQWLVVQTVLGILLYAVFGVALVRGGGHLTIFVPIYGLEWTVWGISLVIAVGPDPGFHQLALYFLMMLPLLLGHLTTRVRFVLAALGVILRNLLTNAIHHSPDGGRVEVRLVSGQTGLTVEVEDHGEGIAAEDLPRIFDRLWRADAARSRRAGRHGLGLALARRHAELLGADLEVRSELGRGTVVVVHLGAAEAASDR